MNGVGTGVSNDRVYTLPGYSGLQEVEEALVRKIVEELKDYDNIYYEVMNEPYFGVSVSLEWQNRIIDIITDAESSFPSKHLISLNWANGVSSVGNPNPKVSIYNFHYSNPDAVTLNYSINRMIGDNETGFEGTSDYVYRKQGWHFVIGGGGLYNNLDLSFSADREDGTDTHIGVPTGGSPALRSQLGILKSFIHSFNFLLMSPQNSVIRGGVPTAVTPRVLAQSGQQYAIYFSGGTAVTQP